MPWPTLAFRQSLWMKCEDNQRINEIYIRNTTLIYLFLFFFFICSMLMLISYRWTKEVETKKKKKKKWKENENKKQLKKYLRIKWISTIWVNWIYYKFYLLRLWPKPHQLAQEEAYISTITAIQGALAWDTSETMRFNFTGCHLLW